jgi:anti-sigma factor RsiW
VSDSVLEDYVLGRLEGESLELVEEHLFGCAHCVERAEAMEEDLKAMKEALEAWPKRERELQEKKDARRPLMRWWLSAAAVLALVAIPVGYRMRSDSTEAYQGTLAAYRAEDTLVVPAGRVDLRLVTDGLPEKVAYRVVLLKESGERVWTATEVKEKLRVNPDQKLSAGIYTVRLFPGDDAEQKELLREILFRVR